MKAREGDLLRDLNGIIFDVKGLVHPPNEIIAFPRFIPDQHGNRRHKGIVYSKVYSISERFKFLEQSFPKYIAYDPFFDEKLCKIPLENVRQHYKPVSYLRRLRKSRTLDTLEKKAVEFFQVLKANSKVPWDRMGISGSLLARLHTPRSDIDPIIYGSENCRRVYSVLQEMLKKKDSPFKPYIREDLKALYNFRSKDTYMDFEDFVSVESRKVLQGKFMGRDYFVRFVKDWSEVNEKYGDVRYSNSGYAKIEATIADDSESIFTLCTYGIEDVRIIEGSKLQPIQEIASFRGRFCEQAKTGETVIAQGKVERVTEIKQNREHYRLLIGNKPSDYMVLVGQS